MPSSHAQIENILPRKTKLSRKVVGRELREQVVGANLDTVFVVTSLNRDFNLRRIERYLTLVLEGGARPVVLLNKSDFASTGPPSWRNSRPWLPECRCTP